MPDILEYIKITDQGFVTYLSFENFYRYRDISIRELRNLENSSSQGVMSKKQKKSVSEIVNTWVCSVVHMMRDLKIKRIKIGYYLSFCTLTLSASQIHCDKTIKRECLNHFLIYLKRKTGLQNYIWISEKQKNGNLHFHLIFDRFIHHELIREIWNKAQEKLGYISRFEKENGHRNAPSENITALKNINNPSAYLIKYISKGSDGVFQCGRMWNCSDKLKNVEQFKSLVDNETNEMLIQFQKTNPSKVYQQEFFAIHKIESKGVETILHERLKNEVKQHYLQTYEYLNDRTM
jgi:hypothetical protein